MSKLIDFKTIKTKKDGISEILPEFLWQNFLKSMYTA